MQIISTHKTFRSDTIQDLKNLTINLERHKLKKENSW